MKLLLEVFLLSRLTLSRRALEVPYQVNCPYLLLELDCHGTLSNTQMVSIYRAWALSCFTRWKFSCDFMCGHAMMSRSNCGHHLDGQLPPKQLLNSLPLPMALWRPYSHMTIFLIFVSLFLDCPFYSILLIFSFLPKQILTFKLQWLVSHHVPGRIIPPVLSFFFSVI